MPQFFIPAIATFITAYVSGATFAAALATAFAVTALNVVAYELQKQPRSGRAPALSSRKQFVRIATPSRKIFYGETTFSPSIFHIENTRRASQKYVVFACAIADHAVAEIKEVIINGNRFLNPVELESLNRDRLIRLLGGGDSVSDARAIANLKRLDGELPTTMNIFIDKDASGDFAGDISGGIPNIGNWNPPPFGGLAEWADTKMKATGISWIVFMLPYHNDVTKDQPWHNIPSVQLRVRRDITSMLQIPGSTGIAADNPAAVLYDYAMKYTNYGKQAFGESMIDTQSFIETAAVCADKGWTCNGVIDLETSPDVVFAEIQQAAMTAVICDIGGKLHFLHKSPSTGFAHELTENDLYGSVKARPFLPSNQRRSGASVEYTRYDAATGLDVIETASVTNDELRDVLGDKKHEINTAFISNRQQALLTAKIALAKDHDSFAIEVITGIKALDILPNDLVRLTIESMGINSKLFRAQGMAINPTGNITLNLAEEIDTDSLEATDQQNFIPALYANYTQTSTLGHNQDGGGDIVIGNDDRIKLILSG